MTLLERYYERRSPDIILTKEEFILFSILADLLDRRGLKGEFLSIDEDIQEEVLQTWLRIIEDEI